MYGTVARFRIKPGAEAQLIQRQREFDAMRIPGYVRAIVYRTDKDPQECYLAVVFDSKESYEANAKSPEQDARYRLLLELMEGEPEWHDGEILHSSSHSSS